MELRDGAGVYTKTGDKVGGVDRVVIDPESREITHIVVRKGTILPKDKVVPTEMIDSADEDRVVLYAAGGDLDDLPDFEEEHFVPAGNEFITGRGRAGAPMPLYWYPPLAGTSYAGGVYPRLEMDPGFAGRGRTVRNIPEDTVPLKEGAKVLAVDDESVGNIERIFTSDDRVTHFIVSSGMISKTRKVVPVSWVNEIGEDEVYLNVGSELISSLPDYRE